MLQKKRIRIRKKIKTKSLLVSLVEPTASPVTRRRPASNARKVLNLIRASNAPLITLCI
jgi:hypothetical protein